MTMMITAIAPTTTLTTLRKVMKTVWKKGKTNLPPEKVNKWKR
jgi:hypothetical protein